MFHCVQLSTTFWLFWKTSEQFWLLHKLDNFLYQHLITLIKSCHKKLNKSIKYFFNGQSDLFSLFLTFQFSSQETNVLHKSLPMTGFKPRTSGVKSNHSINWATTTVQNHNIYHWGNFNSVSASVGWLYFGWNGARDILFPILAHNSSHWYIGRDGWRIKIEEIGT